MLLPSEGSAEIGLGNNARGINLVHPSSHLYDLTLLASDTLARPSVSQESPRRNHAIHRIGHSQGHRAHWRDRGTTFTSTQWS